MEVDSWKTTPPLYHETNKLKLWGDTNKQVSQYAHKEDFASTFPLTEMTSSLQYQYSG